MGILTQAHAIDDPTRPPEGLSVRTTTTDATGAAAPVFDLQSVLVSPGRRVAVINGQTLRPGDRIDGARITTITRNTVHLDTAQGPVTLELLDRDLRPTHRTTKHSP